VTAAAQHLEVDKAIEIRHDGLAVVQARPTLSAATALTDERKTRVPVITPSRVHTRSRPRRAPRCTGCHLELPILPGFLKRRENACRPPLGQKLYPRTGTPHAKERSASPETSPLVAWLPGYLLAASCFDAFFRGSPEARLPGTTAARKRYGRQPSDQRNDILASRPPSGSTVTSTVIPR
jgi:hypothetical protein